MPSAQLDLDVLLILFSIRWIDLGILGACEGIEEVIGQCFRLIEGNFHIGVELLREGIAIVDTEDTFEEVDVDGDIQILPGVVVGQLTDHLGDLLPLDEDALRNA